MSIFGGLGFGAVGAVFGVGEYILVMLSFLLVKRCIVSTRHMPVGL